MVGGGRLFYVLIGKVVLLNPGRFFRIILTVAMAKISAKTPMAKGVVIAGWLNRVALSATEILCEL